MERSQLFLISSCGERVLSQICYLSLLRYNVLWQNLLSVLFQKSRRQQTMTTNLFRFWMQAGRAACNKPDNRAIIALFRQVSQTTDNSRLYALLNKQYKHLEQMQEQKRRRSTCTSLFVYGPLLTIIYIIYLLCMVISFISLAFNMYVGCSKRSSVNNEHYFWVDPNSSDIAITCKIITKVIRNER